jgi:hypothetical protein
VYTKYEKIPSKLWSVASGNQTVSGGGSGGDGGRDFVDTINATINWFFFYYLDILYLVWIYSGFLYLTEKSSFVIELSMI